MASLANCLGKIDLGKPSRFWNEADHAALLKSAKKLGDAGAVKKLADEVDAQMQSLSGAKSEASRELNPHEAEFLKEMEAKPKEAAIKAAAECIVANGL